jgi:hypothetical protein
MVVGMKGNAIRCIFQKYEHAGTIFSRSLFILVRNKEATDSWIFDLIQVVCAEHLLFFSDKY